ncbi:MAG: glycosyltransferase family 39 protein [Phycisphaerales bacterium]
MPAALRPLPTPDRRPLAGREIVLLAAAMLLVWFLAWGHPLRPPDEGRYGSVSATIAETGDWLVPQFRGRPHLTKPPLTYWLQAVGVESFGRSALAVRWPSLVATSLGLGILFAFARRGLGTRPALVATACAAVMPMVLVVGRLANTDALLNLAWIVMLFVGWRIAERDGRGGLLLVAFWAAQAFGFMVKGPAALGPCLILGAWLVLAGRWRDILRFAPWFGLPLAIAPFAAWIALIAMRYPQAAQLWWDETIGRVTGEKDLRAEPFWFYLPIFLAGMYPATAMLSLPGFNFRWNLVWPALRAGDLRALCLVAILFPLLGLSISSGKLATYLLPLAAPTAILVSITIERWLRGEFDRPDAGYRPPDVRRTLAILAVIIFVVELGAAIYAAPSERELWPLVIPLAIVPIGCATPWLWWRGGRVARERGLAVAWVALFAGWTLIFGLETRFTSLWGADKLLEAVEQLLDVRRPQVATVGFVDPTIAFYNGGKPTLEGIELKTLATRTDLEYPLIVAMTPDAVERAIDEAPDVAMELQRVAVWRRWFSKPTNVYVLVQPPRPAHRDDAAHAPQPNRATGS